MKNIIVCFTAVMFFSANAFALGTQVTCDFSRIVNNKGIDEIHINTGSVGSIQVVYANGDVENLAPQRGVGGIFNQIRFSPSISYYNDAKRTVYLQSESLTLGKIQISTICNRPNSVYCETRGGDTLSALTSFNIDGDVFRFDGSKLATCQRSVLR